MVTLAGEGFVAGVTACRFGSSPLVLAEVASSSEASCVSVSAVEGQVTLVISTPTVTESTYSATSVMEVSSMEPAVVTAVGGELVTVLLADTVDTGLTSCLFDGHVLVDAQPVGTRAVACKMVALLAGNASVQVSVNGQDWSAAHGTMVQVVSRMNVSSVEPTVVSVVGGTKVVLSGSGLLLSGAAASAGVYCGVGGGSWSSSLAEVVSSSEAWCVSPARGDGMRVLELSVG